MDSFSQSLDRQVGGRTSFVEQSMDELDVIVASPFTEFSSLGEAVESVRRGDLFEELFASRPLIRKTCAWQDALWLEVEEVGAVRISAFEDGVGVEVLQDDIPPSDALIPDTLTLRYPRGTCEVWKRRDCMKRLCDKRLLGLMYNRPTLFLYAQGLPTIMFCVLRVVSTGRLLLHWSEVE